MRWDAVLWTSPRAGGASMFSWAAPSTLGTDVTRGSGWSTMCYRNVILVVDYLALISVAYVKDGGIRIQYGVTGEQYRCACVSITRVIQLDSARVERCVVKMLTWFLISERMRRTSSTCATMLVFRTVHKIVVRDTDFFILHKSKFFDAVSLRWKRWIRFFQTNNIDCWRMQ